MVAQISTVEIVVWIGACAAMVFCSGLFSGAETGLYCLNRLRLNVHAGHGDPPAIILQRLLGDQAGMLFMTLLGTNVAHYLAPACLTAMFLRSGVIESRAEFYTSVILTPTVLILGDFLPKVLFERHADRLMMRYARFLSAAYWATRFSGLIVVQDAISRFVLRRFHRQSVSGSALHSRIAMYQMLRDSGHEGALTRTQLTMLDRIHTIRHTRVGAVMVPIHQVVKISESDSPSEILRIVRQYPFSRIPVYRDHPRRLIGLVHALDILTADEKPTVANRLYPPVEVKYDTDVMAALTELQHRHRRMAFVVDESGRCLGIVTVKDLVEEIVGELKAW